MRATKGYWLKPASRPEATAGLGFRLEGGRTSVANSGKRCNNCETPVVLFATYRRTEFIPLEKFDAIALELCPACAEESDGSSGGNGFLPSLVMKDAVLSEPILAKPVLFKATPTSEPTTRLGFDKWLPDIVHAKLGGRQISVQAELRAKCKLCKGSLQFVASIDEKWAGDVLNFGGGFGYVFVCQRECSPQAVRFYWDCP
jgi:hypothetical protein